jgi:hypothetical protein
MIEGFLKAQYGNSVTTWANSFATRIKVHAAHLFMKMYSTNASNIRRKLCVVESILDRMFGPLSPPDPEAQYSG